MIKPKSPLPYRRWGFKLVEVVMITYKDKAWSLSEVKTMVY